MAEPILPALPRRAARLCGALYLYVVVAGSFAQLYVRARLVVPRDPAATAANVLANEGLFRLGFTGEFLHLVADVGIAVLLYALLAPVHRHAALLAALMRVASDVVLATVGLVQLAALRLLAGGDYLAALTPDARNALALLALRVHGDGYAVCLLFFGVACLALGWLVGRSGFAPRTLGVLLGLAGAVYLAVNLAHLLAPAAAGHLEPLLVLPFVAELSFALWLLVKGPDPTRWAAVRARA